MTKNPANPAEYIVVFGYTELAGEYAGNRYYTHFKSKEAFEEWRNREIRKNIEVVAQGVTAEEAFNLCSRVSPVCRFKAAIQNSRQENGTINEKVLSFEAANAALATFFGKK